MPAFDWDDFVERCVVASRDPDPLQAVAAVVGEAVADPGRVASTVVTPVDPDDDGVLHRSDELLVVNVLFPQGFATGIHDHRMPAVIGAWAGYEDNLLYRRAPSGMEPARAERLRPGEVLVLGEDAIHDVHAPTTSWSGAVHVYLGDLPAVPRSYWSAVDAPEQPCDPDEMEHRWTELAEATGLVAPAPPEPGVPPAVR